MARALDIAKRNPNAAPPAVSDGARGSEIEKAPPAVSDGARGSEIEKAAELTVVSGAAPGRPSLVGLTRGQMTNVGKGLRATLAGAFTLERPQVVSEQVSRDGTRKWLIRMPATGPLDKG